MEPIRGKLKRPLRAMVRRKLADGEHTEADRIRFLYLLRHPDVLERVCDQLEVKSAEWGCANALAAVSVGDDNSPGWREIIAFLMEHWTEILQLVAIIIPLLAHDREES